MRYLRTLALAAGFAVVGPASAAEPTPKPSLMIVGSPHFGNPGRDLANIQVEDVLTPDRQREVEELVDHLAAYRPTHIAIEWPAAEQSDLDKRYQDYRAGRYTLGRSEHDQIGLRLAAKLGLPRVDAVDWNGNPPGPEAAYDYPAWMEAHGRKAEWDAFLAESKTWVDDLTQRQHCSAIADWFRHLAEPTTLEEFEAQYYQIAGFGDATENPGAAWVGTWAARNLRILSNVRRIAGKPDERTMIIFGAGHASSLTHYGQSSKAFEIVDVRRYLPARRPSRC